MQLQFWKTPPARSGVAIFCLAAVQSTSLILCSCMGIRQVLNRANQTGVTHANQCRKLVKSCTSLVLLGHELEDSVSRLDQRSEGSGSTPKPAYPTLRGLGCFWSTQSLPSTMPHGIAKAPHGVVAAFVVSMVHFCFNGSQCCACTRLKMLSPACISYSMTTCCSPRQASAS